jgi:hypothetical protein
MASATLVHGGETLYNILATRHVNGGGDACALPRAGYDVRYPFALGSIDELSYLKFRPGIRNHSLENIFFHLRVDFIKVGTRCKAESAPKTGRKCNKLSTVF